MVVAAVGVILSACGSSSGSKNPTSNNNGGTANLPGLYGTLPTGGGTPLPGGTVTVGQISGSTPDYILPITPENLASVFNDFLFQYYLWTPLYWSPVGTVPKYDPTLSLASPPTFSDGNKTVTIQMDKTYKWSDGKPVDAADVEFFIDVVRAAIKEGASNWNNYSPGFLPDNIASMSTPSQYTLVLNLTKAYNPGYFYDDQLDLLIPFPSQDWNIASTGGPHLDYTQPANAKKIYDYLNVQSKSLDTYATNPLWQVVDGPMKLTSYTPATGAFTMVPNPTFGGPQKDRVTYKGVTFTSQQAQFNALLAGNVTVGFQLDYQNLPQFPQLKAKGYTIYGYPDFGFQAAFINFKDTTDHFGDIISNLYARQALSELIDQQGIVAGIFHNAAAVSYSTVPAIPSSPYTPSNAVKAPYPYSISKASALLTSHGWKVVPGGQTTCADPGTGPNQCGANIPAGTKFSFAWIYANTPAATGQIATAVAAAAKQVGITITLNQQTFNNAVSNYDNPSSPSYESKWGINDFGGFTQSLYPTTNTIFNTGGDFNLGSYSNPTADSLINQSVVGADPNAVTNEASYLTDSLPVLYMPNPDYIYAIKNNLHGTPNSFSILTQETATPEYWYFTK